MIDFSYKVYSLNGDMIGYIQNVEINANEHDGKYNIFGSFDRAILNGTYENFLDEINKGGIIVKKTDIRNGDIVFELKTKMLMIDEKKVTEQIIGNNVKLIIDSKSSFMVDEYKGEAFPVKKFITYYDSEKGGWTEEAKELGMDKPLGKDDND